MFLSLPDVLQRDWLLLHKTTPHAVSTILPLQRVSEQTVTADTQTTAEQPKHTPTHTKYTHHATPAVYILASDWPPGRKVKHCVWTPEAYAR